MEPIYVKLNTKQKLQVNQVLSEAFSEDPIFCGIFCNQNEIRSFFDLAIEYVNTYGEIHMTEDISGAVLWMPPGVRFLHFGNSFKTFSLIKKSIMFLFCVKYSSLKKLLSLSDFSSTNHPHSLHYYLFAIGVSKQSKGKGIGKKLMNFAFNRFDNFQAYYLENSNVKNLVFYERLGFSLLSASSFQGNTIYRMGKNIPSNSD